jgi:hypothetical protein
MRNIFQVCTNKLPCHPEKKGGGVEVFLRVREAKTKKCAILWTPNVTVVSAQGQDGRTYNLNTIRWNKVHKWDLGGMEWCIEWFIIGWCG